MCLLLLVSLVILVILLIVCLNCNVDNFYNITSINYKTYYFNKNGLAQLCDKKLDIIVSDSNSNFDKKYFENLKDGDKVFLTTNMFKKFIESIKLNKYIVIILSCSDSGFPYEFSKNDNYNYLKYIQHNKFITSVFCSNYDLTYKHHKIKSLPIGIDYHGKIARTSSNLSPNKQEDKLLNIYKNSSPFEKRLNRTYSFFQFAMFDRHNRDRYVAQDALKKINFNDYQKSKMNREDTWRKMVQYKFIISPHGNGLDCHRTYEAIALGCIPIVKTSTLDLMYKDMPIIILNDWNDISLELLNEKIKDALKKSKDTITLNYWKNIIFNNSF